MREEPLSGRDSLQLIQSMINKARNQFSENGHLYLVWGWVVLFCSIGQFVLFYFFRSPWHPLVWLATWVALAYQLVYISRNRKKQKVKTYTGDIISYVWLVFAILMILIGFNIGYNQKGQGYQLLSPVIICLYGMPTFLSGKILRFKPLVYGGLGCWILSVIAAFIPYAFQMLLFGVAVIIAWIIPGYLLRNRYKRELI